MIARFALFLFVLFLAFIVYSADRGALPAIISFYKYIPFGDTLGHFILMGSFAFLATWVLEAKSLCFLKLRVPIGSIIVFLIVLLEEISQLFLSKRTFSFLDLLADFIGIFAFGWLATRLHPSKRSKKAERGAAANH